MSITGSCDCNNFEIFWHTVDHSLVPRACQCDYCLPRGAAYVSKSRTKFDVLIHNTKLHKQVQQGSHTAVFHECAGCEQVVCVTSEIDGEMFGALNARCLNNKFGFPAPIQTDFGEQTADQKRERWRQNWCCPVKVG